MDRFASYVRTNQYDVRVSQPRKANIRGSIRILNGKITYHITYDKEYKEIFALEEVPKDDKTVNNSIHLTAASLSQVGKDSAKNAAKYLKNK